MRVVVFGATGAIGQPLVQALRDQHDVVAVSRQTHPDKAEVEWVRADLADAASVARALEGAEAAYYLAHSLGMDDFEQHDRGAARVFASEAGRAGLQQIIYLGGLGDESPDLSPHLRSRAETGRLLAGGPVPLTTLRAAVVIGKGSAAFETIVALVKRLPPMICPRWVSTPTQPIALGDVVNYLAGVCGRSEAFGRTFMSVAANSRLPFCTCRSTPARICTVPRVDSPRETTPSLAASSSREHVIFIPVPTAMSAFISL